MCLQAKLPEFLKGDMRRNLACNEKDGDELMRLQPKNQFHKFTCVMINEADYWILGDHCLQLINQSKVERLDPPDIYTHY